MRTVRDSERHPHFFSHGRDTRSTFNLPSRPASDSYFLSNEFRPCIAPVDQPACLSGTKVSLRKKHTSLGIQSHPDESTSSSFRRLSATDLSETELTTRGKERTAATCPKVGRQTTPSQGFRPLKLPRRPPVWGRQWSPVVDLRPGPKYDSQGRPGPRIRARPPARSSPCSRPAFDSVVSFPSVWCGQLGNLQATLANSSGLFDQNGPETRLPSHPPFPRPAPFSRPRRLVSRATLPSSNLECCSQDLTAGHCHNTATTSQPTKAHLQFEKRWTATATATATATLLISSWRPVVYTINPARVNSKFQRGSRGSFHSSVSLLSTPCPSRPFQQRAVVITPAFLDGIPHSTQSWGPAGALRPSLGSRQRLSRSRPTFPERLLSTSLGALWLSDSQLFVVPLGLLVTAKHPLPKRHPLRDAQGSTPASSPRLVVLLGASSQPGPCTARLKSPRQSFA